MAYIGKSPTGTGVRSRYYYTATGGETSLSGTDDNGLTLVFSDGNYVDVSLNGIALVAGTDYNTSTANTISGLSALSASDIVEVVVYDIFTVADTVSAKNGGTFSGNVTINGSVSADSLGGLIATQVWSGILLLPDNQSYTLVLNCPFAGTITKTTTKSASGTCTATFKINTTALGGTANSVSSSQQEQSHSSSNAFSVGDDIVVTISSNSSCVDASFTIEYTR